MDITERILALMDETSTTAAQLTKEIPLTNGLVSQWKHGKQKPSLDAIVKIADYFGVTTDYLLKGKEITNDKEAHAMLKRVVNFCSAKNAMVSIFNENNIGLKVNVAQFEMYGEIQFHPKAINHLEKHNISLEEITKFFKIAFILDEESEEFDEYCPTYPKFLRLATVAKCENEAIKIFTDELLNEHNILKAEAEAASYQSLLEAKKGGA